MKASVLLTVLTSASASLCCIVPVFGLIGGSSSLISVISWLEPLKPFFIGGTVLMLGFAWFSHFRNPKTDDCGCEPDKRSFFQSKKFLGIVTIVSLLFIAFPSFSGLFLQSGNEQVASADQNMNKKITLSVSGMTCSSCEHHIESEVIKLSGVSSVKASYEGKSTTVEFDPQKVDQEKIIATINETGYRVKKRAHTMHEETY